MLDIRVVAQPVSYTVKRETVILGIITRSVPGIVAFETVNTPVILLAEMQQIIAYMESL